jgi:hypothetical protein
MEIRRVITAEQEGRGVFARVEEVEPVHGAVEIFRAWGWDKLPTLPVHGADWTPGTQFPPPGGVRVTVVEFPPGIGVDHRSDDVQTEEGRRLREAGGHVRDQDADTGMHRSDGIDVAFVLSGEMGLEQDNGVEVTLRPGDVLVQQGARHAWRNRSGKPVLMGFVVFGAERSG